MKEKGKTLNGIIEAACAIAGIAPVGTSKMHEFKNYDEYLKNNTSTEEQLEEQRKNPLNPAPLISIAIVAKGADVGMLESTIESLQSQTYDNWEACLAFGLDDYGSKGIADTSHFRVVIASGTVKELSELINHQLRGAYMLQLFPGDILTQDALYTLAQALMDPSSPEVVFADEEMTDENGIYPYFKPDYGRLTIMNHNSVGRPLLVAKRVFDLVGGFKGAESFDIWKFALLALSNSKMSAHIARVLMSSKRRKDVSLSPKEIDEMDRILADRVDKRANAYCVEGHEMGTLRIRYVPKRTPQVSIIIPNIDSIENLKRCIESIEMRSTYSDYRIFVADDKRNEPLIRKYLDALKKTRAAKPIEIKSGMSIPAILNYCARAEINDMLLFINGSCEIQSPDFIEELSGLASMKKAGAVGGKIIDTGGNIVSVGDVIGLRGWAGSPYKGENDDNADRLKSSFTWLQRNVSAVSGSFMAIKAQRFMTVGLFDETLSGVGWDTELCIRLMRRGYENYFTPYAAAKLYGELPDYDDASSDNLTRCYDSFRQTLMTGDGYYNPNYDYAASEPVLNIKPYKPICLNPNYK